MEIVSDPGPDDTYGEGGRIRVQLTFTRPVVVDTSSGTPRLRIDFHTAATGLQWADYLSGSGTEALLFDFTVVSANRSTEGVAVVADTLQHNGGTITSADGLNAELGHTGLDHDTEHMVDGSAPESVLLVSNLGQHVTGAISLQHNQAAQGFTTGSHRLRVRAE